MNHRARHPQTLIKAGASSPAGLLSACTDLPMCPLKASYEPPPGPVSNKFLHFTFPYSLLLNFEVTIHDTPGLYLTNGNLTTKKITTSTSTMTWTKSILPYNPVYINEHQKSKQPVNHYNQASHHHKNYCNLMTPSFTHPFSPNSSAQLTVRQ